MLANPNAMLGRTARDRITGFVGVVIGHVVYLTGCNQSLLVPKVGVDGAYSEPHWFDDGRLEIQPGEPIELAPVAMWPVGEGAGPGFDKAAPKR